MSPSLLVVDMLTWRWGSCTPLLSIAASTVALSQTGQVALVLSDRLHHGAHCRSAFREVNSLTAAGPGLMNILYCGANLSSTRALPQLPAMCAYTRENAGAFYITRTGVL